jgi:hypothetical protein
LTISTLGNGLVNNDFRFQNAEKRLIHYFTITHAKKVLKSHNIWLVLKSQSRTGLEVSGDCDGVFPSGHCFISPPSKAKDAVARRKKKLAE